MNKRFSSEIKTAGVCFKGINHELLINKDLKLQIENLQNKMKQNKLEPKQIRFVYSHSYVL